MFWRHFTNASIPSLTNKVAIVTGANTGVGFHTALQLAGKGAHVFLACRSEQRAQDAINKIKSEFKDAKVEFLHLDLKDMQQAKEAAEGFIKKGLTLDILVNNAGIMAPPFELTKQGIESQIAVNHFGHFVFTMCLLPALRKSKSARIVNLSSIFHDKPRSDLQYTLEYLNDQKLSVWERYGNSKIANIFFTQYLAEKLKPEGIWVYAVHPGWVDSELKRGMTESYGSLFGAFFSGLNKIFAYSPADGALTSLYCATSPEVDSAEKSGLYYIPLGKVGSTTKLAQNKELRDQLWDLSVKLCKEKINLTIKL